MTKASAHKESTHMSTHTHRPMHGVVGWYCGACGLALLPPPPPNPVAVLAAVIARCIAEGAPVYVAQEGAHT